MSVRDSIGSVQQEASTAAAGCERQRMLPLNLLYFTTAYDSGIFGNRVHGEFLAQLQERGHTVAVLTPDARRRQGARVECDTGDPPVYRAAVSMTSGDRLLNLAARQTLHYDHFLTALAAYRSFMRTHPAISLTHVESVYPLGAVAALAGGRPFIATIRGGDLIADDEIAYGFARFASVRLLLRLTFRRAALVRAVSPGAREMALRYGCPPAKIVVAPRNIRDDCYFDDVAGFRERSRLEIAQQYGVQHRTILVAAGRLLPVKGFDDLIRAMPAILRDVPDAVLLLCGPNRVDSKVGDYAAYLAELAVQFGVADRVIQTGHVPPERMAVYLAAADAVAVPSLIEGGNKILVEGAALGTPFVATETAGTVGFFDARHGLVVPPRDPACLAAALSALLRDPVSWSARSAACLAHRDRFRSGQVAEAMEAYYQQAVERR